MALAIYPKMQIQPLILLLGVFIVLRSQHRIYRDVYLASLFLDLSIDAGLNSKAFPAKQ